MFSCDKNWISLLCNLGRIDIFIILSLLIHEQNPSLYCFRSTLITRTSIAASMASTCFVKYSTTYFKKSVFLIIFPVFTTSIYTSKWSFKVGLVFYAFTKLLITLWIYIFTYVFVAAFAFFPIGHSLTWIQRQLSLILLSLKVFIVFLALWFCLEHPVQCQTVVLRWDMIALSYLRTKDFSVSPPCVSCMCFKFSYQAENVFLYFHSLEIVIILIHSVHPLSWIGFELCEMLFLYWLIKSGFFLF